MYLLAENKIEIKAPPADVFEYAADLTNFAEWFPGVVAVAAKGDRHFTETGKKYTETVRMPLGKQDRVNIRVKECRPGEFIATEGHLKPLYPRMEMEFRDTGGHILLTWRMYSRGRGMLLRLLILPLAGRVMAKRSREGLSNLKLRFEKKQPAPA